MTEQKIIPGAESFYYPGSSTGILLCHGFNGTPQSVEYIGKLLASEGFTVYAPLLTGHGTCEEDMEKCSYEEWIHDVEKAYCLLKKDCRQVFAIGQSMGGALALNLAGRSDCSGIITINAALEVPAYERFEHRESPSFLPDGKPDIKNPTAQEITYERIPLKAIKQLIGLMRELRPNLECITCPSLIIRSLDDHVVPPYCSSEIFQRISSIDKELIDLDNSFHVATLDYDQNRIAAEAIQFIRRQMQRECAS